jgi:parvulin-like peptidyl-prolyl isomerase
MRDLLRRQVLESLIRLELLTLEAKRQGITATAAEAEEVLKRDAFFNPGGQFDQNRYVAVKTTQKASFDAALATIQSQLAGRKLNDRVIARYMPAEGPVKLSAQRALSRVTVDHLSLHRPEFDGSYAEPRESDVLAYYRTHAEDFARPDRASLTVAFVNTPGLTDSLRRIPGRAEAWNRRMKEVADSVLAVIAAGEEFGKAAAFLSPRPGIVVQSDNFPGYWRGTPAQERRLFDLAMNGKVLPEAVQGEEGWMLVRVDQATPAHVADLREVSRQIRGVLRRDRKAHADEYEQRSLFASLRDSLSAPGLRVRYAVFDTSRITVPEPKPADLDRYYRGHLADYSGFDAATGSITARPLDEVRADVRARFMRDERLRTARLGADAVQRAWAAGKKDARYEALASIREVAAPRGADFDSTSEGSMLADTVWAHADPRGGLFSLRGNWVAWQVAGKVERVTPTFAQARTAVAQAVKLRRDLDDLAGARRMYDENPRQFSRGDVISFSTFTVPPPPLLTVPLTRAEVEKYHRENIDKYSAPELIRARHILVHPATETPAGDAEAMALARRLIERIRAGESPVLAKEFSTDVSTKDVGGDLGVFGRGTMLADFERAAFALPAGEMAPEPVRTELGYHVIQVTEHEPAVIQPLVWIYATVSSDAALAKGERMAAVTADSMMRAARTPAQMRRIAEKYGYLVTQQDYKIGTNLPSALFRPFYLSLEKLKPGQLITEPFKAKGQGTGSHGGQRFDAATPAGDVRTLAAETTAAEQASALQAKRAEMDRSPWRVVVRQPRGPGAERARHRGRQGHHWHGGAAIRLRIFAPIGPASRRVKCLPALAPNGITRFRMVSRPSRRSSSSPNACGTARGGDRTGHAGVLRNCSASSASSNRGCGRCSWSVRPPRANCHRRR